MKTGAPSEAPASASRLAMIGDGTERAAVELVFIALALTIPPIPVTQRVLDF
jgi:hypothetical protein